MLVANYSQGKVFDILNREQPNKVILIFWHGLGDLVLFMECYAKLCSLFHHIQIDIALQDGVGQEYLIPEAVLIKNPNAPVDGYDISFQIHFPMSEHLDGLWTKAEWCCLQELGIEPISKLPKIGKFTSKLVGIHFQATALPGDCNPDYETAKKIWQEIIGCNFMPVETLFQHRYFNPANEKHDFINTSVRGLPPSLENLISLLHSCYANICVASGNLPMSLSIMPDRTLYLKKSYDVKCYTRLSVSQVDVNDYQDGAVTNWLMSLD